MKKHFTRSRAESRQSGSVLIVVVFVLMLLSVWVLGFAKETRSLMRSGAEKVSLKKAMAAAEAGLEYSLFLLETQRAETLDGAHRFSDSQFRYQIRNEDGKIDLNSLVDGDGRIVEKQKEILVRFLNLAGREADAAKWVARLADWVDADKEPRVPGSETSVVPGLSPTGFPFQSLAEWRLAVGGKTGGEASLLRKACTVFSTGKVNINTAPLEVVASLSPEMNAPLAKAIVAAQRKKGFKTLDDLKKVRGMNDSVFFEIEPLLAERGTYYSVVVTGSSGERTVRMGAVAKREEERLKIVWHKKELTDEDLLEWD